jgi:hypothetical protein
MGYDTEALGSSLPTFRRNSVFISKGLDVLQPLEDEDNIFLRNVGRCRQEFCKTRVNTTSKSQARIIRFLAENCAVIDVS